MLLDRVEENAGIRPSRMAASVVTSERERKHPARSHRSRACAAGPVPEAPAKSEGRRPTRPALSRTRLQRADRTHASVTSWRTSLARRGTERTADRELSLTRSGARQQQIRHVHTHPEQQQRHASEQHQKHQPHIANRGVEQWNNCDSPIAVVRVVRCFNPVWLSPTILPALRPPSPRAPIVRRHSASRPSRVGRRAQARKAAILRPAIRPVRWSGRRSRVASRRRWLADLAVEQKGLAHHRGIAAVPALPETRGSGRPLPARRPRVASVVNMRPASGRRPKHMEEVRGHAIHEHLGRLAAPRHGRAFVVPRGDVVERLAFEHANRGNIPATAVSPRSAGA